MIPRLFAIVICLPVAGCVVVEVGVTNPIPGLSTVAVAPFLNLSQDPTVDGRRFAMAYFTELQKIPGFQVVPVGVVEQVLIDLQLELSNPHDVLLLAEELEVDVVVVGAVTDYEAYYPPRIGLQIAWYSPEPWRFTPGVPVDPYARSRFRRNVDEKERRQERYRRIQRVQQEKIKNANRRMIRDEKKALQGEQPGWNDSKLRRVIRGQSPGVPPRVRANSEVDLSSRDLDAPGSSWGWIEQQSEAPIAWRSASISQQPLEPVQTARLPEQPAHPVRFLGINSMKSNHLQIGFSQHPVSIIENSVVPIPKEFPPPMPDSSRLTLPAETMNKPSEPPIYLEPPDLKAPEIFSLPLLKVDSSKPIMSYTRMFDGSDADLIAALRDYVEIGGDLRSGSWQAYLYRSEDFIRFTAHMMIVEMLALHGGQGKRRVVFKLRKHK